MIGRFFRFAAIGGLGFFVDVGVLYAVLAATGLGPYLGRAISFLAAVTFTWWCNRSFTFGAGRPKGLVSEWARFASVNLFGGLVNYGVYAALVASADEFARQPFLAVAAGSAAGLVLNFVGSNFLVFRPGRGSQEGQGAASV